MSGREIVTLQLGHYSNFTGTHWWNIQESSFIYDPTILQKFPKELNHDILFREGQTSKGDVTFTPRLIALDLQGSLKTLPREGTLYQETREEEVRWSGDVTLHKSDTEPKNPFLQDLDDQEIVGERSSKEDTIEQSNAGSSQQGVEPVVFGRKFYNLDDHVTVWSDYLNMHLHPRSIQLAQGFILNSEDQPFDVFGLGSGVLSGEAWEAWEDRIRFFTEECDLMQGFHLLFDSHNGFGGAAAKTLTYLSDEFPGKARLTLPLTPAIVSDQTAAQRATRILNNALCVGTMCADASLYVPLSLASSLWRSLGAPHTLPHLSYNADLPYHCSAVLAASLDTLTLPVRRETGHASLCDVTNAMSSLGRKIASVDTCFPLSFWEQETFTDVLMSQTANELWRSLTPNVVRSDPIVQSCVVRGVPSDRVKREGTLLRQLSSCKNVEDILRLYLEETYPGSLNGGCVVRDALKVATPFPHIFKPTVTPSGLLSATERHATCGVQSVPMMTSLQSSAGVGHFASSLHSEASRFNIRRHHHFLQAGLDEEEFTDIVDTLKSLADCYNQSYSL